MYVCAYVTRHDASRHDAMRRERMWHRVARVDMCSTHPILSVSIFPNSCRIHPTLI